MQGQAFALASQGLSTHTTIVLDEKSFYCKAFYMDDLRDGTYEVFVYDARDAPDGAARVELVITSGARKGDTIALRVARDSVDPIDLMGMPATLSVVDGEPRLRVDRA